MFAVLHPFAQFCLTLQLSAQVDGSVFAVFMTAVPVEVISHLSAGAGVHVEVGVAGMHVPIVTTLHPFVQRSLTLHVTEQSTGFCFAVFTTLFSQMSVGFGGQAFGAQRFPSGPQPSLQLSFIFHTIEQLARTVAVCIALFSHLSAGFGGQVRGAQRAASALHAPGQRSLIVQVTSQVCTFVVATLMTESPVVVSTSQTGEGFVGQVGVMHPDPAVLQPAVHGFCTDDPVTG